MMTSIQWGDSRADVEMGNEEENKNMKIQDMLFTGVGVLPVSKVDVLVDNIELNC